MPHILDNKLVKLLISLPGEAYRGTRYDWTGMITHAEFDGRLITGSERKGATLADGFGQGFCNEFGIKMPVGYASIPEGAWFHKIGVGWLRKDTGAYDFLKNYQVKPAEFRLDSGKNYLTVSCTGPLTNGYAYVLLKTIHLRQNGFEISYELTNTGQHSIITNEYNHNFLQTGQQLIGSDYLLEFPFALDTGNFDEYINPNSVVKFEGRQVTFKKPPGEDFFFSDLSGSSRVLAQWTLDSLSTGLRISEEGDFRTTAVHLWGNNQVISPELYVDLAITPGQTRRWSRTYALSYLL